MPQLLTWISYAVDFETKSLDFYTECYKNAKDETIKELFRFLMTEEAGHKAILTQAREWSSERNKDKLIKSMKDYKKIPTKSPTFSEKDLMKLSNQRTAVTEVINTAMTFEEKGLAFYNNLVKQEKDPAIKSFLRRLANDERTHKKVIKSFGASILRF